MIPGRIEGARLNLGAPDGWDPERDGDCAHLPVRVEVREGGKVALLSAWMPTPDEVEAIVAGAPVYLTICDTSHPVVALGVGPVPELG